MWNITKKIQEFIDINDTVLDVMCGRCAPTKDLKARFKIGIDLYEPALQIARQYCTPVRMDARLISQFFLQHAFDIILWLDGMEHLEAKEAVKVLAELEQIANKRVILHVPQEWFDNKDSDLYRNEGELQVHRHYFPRDFYIKRGYKLVQAYPSPEKHASFLFVKDIPEGGTDARINAI